MPPTLGDRLIHILEAIESIQEILAGNSQVQISENRMLRLALERLFEIVCEASRRVPADVTGTETAIDWRRITDLGNILRHAYHRIDIARLTTIADEDLPPLKSFVERVLREEQKR